MLDKNGAQIENERRESEKKNRTLTIMCVSLKAKVHFDDIEDSQRHEQVQVTDEETDCGIAKKKGRVS